MVSAAAAHCFFTDARLTRLVSRFSFLLLSKATCVCSEFAIAASSVVSSATVHLFFLCLVSVRNYFIATILSVFFSACSDG